MTTIHKKFKESGFGEPKVPEVIKETTHAVLGVVEQQWGVYVTPSWREMVQIYWCDPLIKTGIDHFALQTVSTGFFPSQMGKNYNLVLNGKTALDVINEWCVTNDVQTKLYEIATELRGFGNCFYRLDKRFGLQKIPIEAIWHFFAVAPEIPLQVQYNLQLQPMYNMEVIPWGEFIHFRINVTGFKAPEGMGVIYPLIARPRADVPSLYEVRLALRKSLTEGMLKFSFGNSIWSFKGMTNDDFEASGLAAHIAAMKSTGQRIVTNAEGSIVLEVPQRTESYNKFIETMNSEVLMGIDNPTLKLGMQEGVYTKASSVSATQQFQFEVASMRRVIAEMFEKIWAQVLTAHGFDPKEAQIRFNFGMEEVEPTLEDIMGYVQAGIISPREARRNLMKRVKLELDSENVPADAKPALTGPAQGEKSSEKSNTREVD